MPANKARGCTTSAQIDAQTLEHINSESQRASLRIFSTLIDFAFHSTANNNRKSLV
jgi:hypothetical protein